MIRKLKSTKFWVTLWACFIVTYIVVTKQVEMESIAVILSSAPLVYMGANVGQKFILGKKEM